MAEVEFFGTVKTADGRTPLVARANEEDRERISRRVSGDVLFTSAADMRSLEELLAAHEVLFAVLERPGRSAVDDENVDALHTLDWREHARRQLAYNRDISQRDEVMDEDFVFLAALPSTALDDVLRRAYALLGAPATTEEGWFAFLEDEARAAEQALTHSPIDLVDSETGDSEPEPSAPPPLFTLADLSVSFGRGAFGGPRPIADSAQR